MKVTMVMVMTLDGKITKGNEADVTKWTSKEDQVYFSTLVKENNLIVMGSNTYEAAKHTMKINKGKLRIVLTKNPKKYQNQIVSNQLEFKDESPRQLVTRLKKKYSRLLLLGGGVINALFLKDNLVDELYLTIEPKIFGQGKPIVRDQNLNTKLMILSMKKINKQGTLLLKYKIVKP